MTSQDASSLMREAHALKAAGRLEEAVSRYGEAVAANPRSGVAEHNLAACLGDLGRWAEAAPHIDLAFSKGLDAGETWLVKARCALALGQLDQAEWAFGEAIVRRRDLYDAHRELAQLRWMTTGDGRTSLAGLEEAIRLLPGDLNLVLLKVQALQFTGQEDEAFRYVGKLATDNPGFAILHLRAAEVAGDLGCSHEALAHAQKAVELAPQDSFAQLGLATALLQTGEADSASSIIENVRAAMPENQHALALQATAWRLMGDPRYRVLYDYENLVGVDTLEPPTGWASLESYVGDVALALHQLHAFREHPFNHSIRHGSQCAKIQQHPHPALRALPSALEGSIKRYLARLGHGVDPVRARNGGGYEIQGMWSVKLHPGGFHVDHVHQEGWLSSACHLETVAPKGREGWLRFGHPGVKTEPALEAEHYVEPKRGHLVLFPSYMWHGTEPFTGDQSRLTFAFDLVPAIAR